MHYKAGSPLSRLWLIQRALNELGPRSIGFYTLYQIGLSSGYFRLASRSAQVGRVHEFFQKHPSVRLKDELWALPAPDELFVAMGEAGLACLLSEAEDILNGKVRLFGAAPTPLILAFPGSRSHWTVYARDAKAAGLVDDIKFIWEPARFGWAILLARAYYCTGDERFADSFWEHTEVFLNSNPAYCGFHWVSAQEVALRLIAMVFAWQIFNVSPHSTPERAIRLAEAVTLHASRIPLTHTYARAQNNNHLLSEAAGLITAGLALPELPQAASWLKRGWSWFVQGILSQIDEQGVYLQHSANYHRLMLHLALWLHCLSSPVSPVGQASSLSVSAGGQAVSLSSPSTGAPLPAFPPSLLQRLAVATRWLLALHDPATGCVPNFGPNDGALVLPLSASCFSDYRPVLQAAASAFLNRAPFPPGGWDEALLWLGIPKGNPEPPAVSPAIAPEGLSVGQPHEIALNIEQPSLKDDTSGTPHTLHSPDNLTWAFLRLANFTSRPGHADLLHLDLWWRGCNVAQDAGTYLYNGASPWDNPLAETIFHNTITINGASQMRRVGRFLFLDWARARLVSHSPTSITAEQNGYRRLGLLHRRTVSLLPGMGWQIDDQLLPLGKASALPVDACLHWLLPDWEFKVNSSQNPDDGNEIYEVKIKSPYGWVILKMNLTPSNKQASHLQITRAGELVYGAGPIQPTWGWSSPTYGQRLPALSLRLYQYGNSPLSFSSQFHFPG